MDGPVRPRDRCSHPAMRADTVCSLLTMATPWGWASVGVSICGGSVQPDLVGFQQPSHSHNTSTEGPTQAIRRAEELPVPIERREDRSQLATGSSVSLPQAAGVGEDRQGDGAG